MLWGIPATTWLELWSGAIGAFVSAIGAAAVAWLVVKATNAHQEKLANANLENQRREARRAEMTQALASFIAGVREIGSIHYETDILEVNATIRQLEASAAALDILGDDDEGLYSLLHPSIRTLHTLSIHVVADYQFRTRTGAREALADCARAICTLTPKWWSNEEGHERRFIRGEVRLTLEAADSLCKKLRITRPAS